MKLEDLFAILGLLFIFHFFFIDLNIEISIIGTWFVGVSLGSQQYKFFGKELAQKTSSEVKGK